MKAAGSPWFSNFVRDRFKKNNNFQSKGVPIFTSKKKKQVLKENQKTILHMVVLESTIPNFRTKTPAVFFFRNPEIPREKKNRKIGPHRGRKEIVCGYKEKKNHTPLVL